MSPVESLSDGVVEFDGTILSDLLATWIPRHLVSTFGYRGVSDPSMPD
jgi:hypothetical protein